MSTRPVCEGLSRNLHFPDCNVCYDFETSHLDRWTHVRWRQFPQKPKITEILKDLAPPAVLPYMTALSPVKPQEDSLATRWSLLGRIKDTEDDKSWNEFHDLYRGLILGVARKAGLQDAEALDVLQETMTAVSKNIGGFTANPERGSFRAWLLQMARWRIMDQLRKRLPIPAASSRSDKATATTPTVERVPDPREVDLERLCDAEWKEQLMKQALKEVQLQIKAEHYQIFHLLEIERKTIPDVAKMVGRNRAQIYVIRHRVTNALRKIVKGLERKAP